MRERAPNKSLERDVFSVTRFALHSKNTPQLKRFMLSCFNRNDVKFRQEFLVLVFELFVVDNFNYGLPRLHYN